MVGTFFNLLALAAATKLVAGAPAPELVTVTVPPFFEPESLSTAVQAAVVGVDSEGHTTYALKQDQVESSSTLAFVTGTLVAGGDPAVADYTISFTSQAVTVLAGFDCGLQSDGAVCSGVAAGGQGPQTAALSVTQLVLDVTGTAAPASATPISGSVNPVSGSATPASGSASPTNGSSSPVNGNSSQPTGNGVSPTQPTGSKPSSAQTLSASAFMLISPLLAYYLL
ncbi:hypothetical protein FB45DRAFT_1003275 [Roridomyces roridus]|uniref:Uncharacterized protein n=1 Tax=Roridomyces roridus TaxID=1738132 RepID=A0AAD7BXJ6_9AGAR|nr:hypothetical protein FB45DRAFT_1003275 [Roridomyces roridus]